MGLLILIGWIFANNNSDNTTFEPIKVGEKFINVTFKDEIPEFKMQDVLEEGYKNLEDFLAENCEAGVLDLYDKERGIVYNNSYYMERHQKYLEYLKNQDLPSGDDIER